MLKLLLKNKLFSIPSDFCSLNDVKSDIYKELISNRQYKVKSNVHVDLFQLFIDNWVYNKALDININNFFELVLLSEEFDRIKDLIQLFYRLNQNNNHLLKTNQEIKQKLETKKHNIKNEKSNYSQIIHFLFDNNRIGSHSELIDIRSDLFQAFKKNDIKLVDLLTRKKFKDENGLLFVLNEKDLTAGLFNNSKINGDVLIPKTITYESQKYSITDIFERAFQFSKNIKSIQFSEQSEIRTIGKNAFFASTLSKIKIPKNVKCIEERAFSFCKQLKSIEFFENSELNSIGSHSFSSSSVECISLPSNLIEVGERAFSECFNLETVNFSMNSKLSSIGKQAFSYTSIKNVSIPCHVKEIGEYSFAHNNKLKEVEFAKESELVSISEYAFCSSSIEKLIIPSSIVEFKEGWCCKTANLNNITIIPNKEKNLIYYEDKFILGKSDLKSDIYDILYFSRRDIKINNY